jgi:hypothetical protein
MCRRMEDTYPTIDVQSCFDTVLCNERRDASLIAAPTTVLVDWLLERFSIVASDSPLFCLT